MAVNFNKTSGTSVSVDYGKLGVFCKFNDLAATLSRIQIRCGCGKNDGPFIFFFSFSRILISKIMYKK